MDLFEELGVCVMFFQAFWGQCKDTVITEPSTVTTVDSNRSHDKSYIIVTQRCLESSHRCGRKVKYIDHLTVPVSELRKTSGRPRSYCVSGLKAVDKKVCHENGAPVIVEVSMLPLMSSNFIFALFEYSLHYLSFCLVLRYSPTLYHMHS